MLILLLVLLVCARGLDVVEMATTGNDNTTTNNAGVFTKPGCESKYGDVTVPYPFGIRSEGLNCSINPSDIFCNKSTNPPKAFIADIHYVVTDISDTELRVRNFLAERCYNSSGSLLSGKYTYLPLGTSPYTFSEANVLTGVGCDETAYIYDNKYNYSPKGCITSCSEAAEVDESGCSGTGCCQVPINSLKYVRIYVRSFDNHTAVSSFNPCGYAFFGEKNSFKFRGASDLNDPTFINRTMANVPIVLDWVIAENRTCDKAAQDKSYACISENSFCVEFNKSSGYRCSCKQGYEGNPYINSGCKDIDECVDPTKNDCKHNICKNTPGNYTCLCPDGYNGDGRTCQKSSSLAIKLGAGI